MGRSIDAIVELAMNPVVCDEVWGLGLSHSVVKVAKFLFGLSCYTLQSFAIC